MCGAVSGFGGSAPSLVYATWDPANKSTNFVLSNANLTATGAFGDLGGVRATIGKSAGKWYWELLIQASGYAFDPLALPGIVGSAYSFSDATRFPLAANPSAGQYSTAIYKNTSSAVGGVSNLAHGTVVGCKLDMDAATFELLHNNVSKGTVTSLTAGTYYPAFGDGVTDFALGAIANFGASAFTYSVPSGYNAGVYN